MQITSPSGYVFKLKRDYITVRESQDIQNIYLRNAKLKGSEADVDLTLTVEAQKKIFETLVTEIVTPDNKPITEKLYEYYLEMRSSDGAPVMEQLLEIAYGKKNSG